MADESRKKVLIISISSLVLVAMVIAITFGSKTETDSYSRQDISSSQKAVQTICAPTDYKDVCFSSLKSTSENTSDPKELIEAAFRVTIDYLNDAAENSTVLQELEKDPRTKLALDNCRELSNRAIDDIQKTYNRFQDFDFSNLDQMFADLQTWLSGAITYQETCLDGFNDTQGDAAKKMRDALSTAMQLSSNGLAMITDISSVLSSFDGSPAQAPTSRRLLSEDHHPVLAHDGFFPDWFVTEKRMLLDAPMNSIKPDLIVAKDGSGKFRTINEALEEIPKKSERTFILYIKEGVYEEKVQFNSSLTHLMVVGDGPTKTRITGSLNFIDGTPTYHTATVAVLGDFFIGKDIGIENSAGAEKHQAVALRVGADKSVFYNCHMDGYQDTLYAHTYRQFYRNCQVSGTIDFIFGDAAAIFQGCTFVVRKPMENQQCIVTAQGRKDLRQPTGIIIQNCSFVADPEYYPVRNTSKSYLGRPWKQFSRTIIMESFIDDLIQPQGWLPWNETFALDTLFYTEFNNRGPGSPKENRIKWTGVKELPSERIRRFTASKFIEAESWLPATGVPYDLGFIFPLPKENNSVKYSPPSSQENKDLGTKKVRESYVTKKNSTSDKDEDDMLPSPAFSPALSPAPMSSPGSTPADAPGSTLQKTAPGSAPSFAPGSSLQETAPGSAPAAVPGSSLQKTAPSSVPAAAPGSSLQNTTPGSAPATAPGCSLQEKAPGSAPAAAPGSSLRKMAPGSAPTATPGSSSAPRPSPQQSDLSSPASAPVPAPRAGVPSQQYSNFFPGFL